MPLVQTKTVVVSAACEICGKVYKGPDAEAYALQCERQGKPKHHYPIGTEFTVRQSNGIAVTYTITAHVVCGQNHQPGYMTWIHFGWKYFLPEWKVTKMIKKSLKS